MPFGFGVISALSKALYPLLLKTRQKVEFHTPTRAAGAREVGIFWRRGEQGRNMALRLSYCIVGASALSVKSFVRGVIQFLQFDFRWQCDLLAPVALASSIRCILHNRCTRLRFHRVEQHLAAGSMGKTPTQSTHNRLNK